MWGHVGDPGSRDCVQELGGGPEYPRVPSTPLDSDSQPGVTPGTGSAPLAKLFLTCVSLLTYPVRLNYLNLN